MLGALIGGGIGGLIGGYLGASTASSHSSGGSRGGRGYSIDNYDAMKKELEAIRKNREKIEEFKKLSDKQQKQIIENTEGLKELLELNIRLSLMTEDEKLVFRQILIDEEMKEEQEKLESRIENILNHKKHSPPDFNNRFEHRGYILDLIDICYCLYAEEWDYECGDDDKKFIVGYIGNAPIYNTSTDETINLCEKVAKKYNYDVSTVYRDASRNVYPLYKLKL